MVVPRHSLIGALLASLVVLVSAGLAEAQTLRFQLQPLCNKVTLSFSPTPSNAVLSFVGYDDNCGERPHSPIYGTVILNPDGGVTFGYTTSLPYSVYGRTDVGLQTNVEWPGDSNVGFWIDDDGDSGTFVFDLLDQPSG